MALFDEHDLHAIQHAVEQAEAKSAGEIVIVSVAACDEYGPYRAAWAAIMATLVCGLAAFFMPQYPAYAYVLSILPALLFFWLLSGMSFLVRMIVPRDVREAAMQARLMQAFSENRVYATRDRSGLVFLICETERLVGVLGDSGIHAHVRDEGWQKYVNTIVQGIRNKEAGKAVVSVIEHVGDVLAHIAPRRSDDINELPDRVQQH